MSDKDVIAGIESAVEAAPENASLRLHLVDLLLEAERAEDALKHCSMVLAESPDNAGALALGARAAAATGDREKADAYRRLHQAIAPPETEEEHPEPAEPIQLRLVTGGVVDDDDSPVEVEVSKVTLADVAGLDAVKRRLQLAFLGPMKNPKMMKAYGKSLRGGLLLYGPPGCGKTFIARATAGELGARFISVGLAEVLDMYLGQSERNLHEIFEAARRNAPCVLFFDEIDALGRKRSLVRNSAEHNVVNQLLSELDSVGNENKDVFVLAASNHPWDVDTALRRPGRLDRVLLVLPPDQEAREGILRYHLRDRPTEKIDTAWIAARSNSYSGADLAHVCESATELAIEAALEDGEALPVTMTHMKKALKEIKPSTRPWFEIARNYAQFSNEGGVYDDLLDYLRAERYL